MSHVSSYIGRLAEETPEAVISVKSTIEALENKHFRTFSHMDHVVGLLLGQVQSGKTGQMFGLLSSAADSGFDLFLVLTSGMTALQQQTFERAIESLEDTFTVCDENDDTRFYKGKLRRPTIVVLKKNATVLKKWKNHLASSGYCNGRPIFIIDDEADATSLNTKINSKDDDVSTINGLLEDIKGLCTSSFYLQVTATPQPILLQAQDSGWRPEFIHYFPPGKNYLGGEFFYSKPKPFTNVTTEDDELSQLIDSNETPTGLIQAMTAYLVTTAHIMSNRGKVCNFLVHPSSRIDDHSTIGNKIKEYVYNLLSNLDDPTIQKELHKAYLGLQASKPDIIEFSKVIEFLNNTPDFNFITMNSGPDSDSSPDISTGMNIVVGGNSLGRGVTFKGLQTVYYLRSSKTPQADTFWQHCRMFGYDRDPLLMRVFMPQALYNLFAEINSSNQVIFKQIQEGKLDDMQLMLAKGIKPTRSSVIDMSKLDTIVGGVNYFPPDPDQSNADTIDPLLERYDPGKAYHEIEVSDAVAILSKLRDDEINNWRISSFIAAVEASALEKNGTNKVALIVRLDRSIGRQTGTMLSPDDRKLGASIVDKPVITFYRNVGEEAKGWNGKPFWMTNLKLTDKRVFYASRDE